MDLILDECSVDLIPLSWKTEKSIINYIQKYKRIPVRNGAYHQHLLKNILKEKRHDRPDILHFGLLTILGYSQIVKDLNIFFSCPQGTFNVRSDTRLPRDQNRFYGLLENLFLEKSTNQFIQRSDFQVNPKSTIVFTKKGEPIEGYDLRNYSSFVFGGFAYGSLDEKYPNSPKVSLSDHSLDLWIALSLFLNNFK